MTTKRKPPAIHHTKQEVNKKALLWVGISIFLVIIALTVLLILNI
ncbi:hypothetical protein [Paenibacillus crassostreae]|nr:hypothetical protein [Paenibacillus crassostreae]